jgi:hypothetical protein
MLCLVIIEAMPDRILSYSCSYSPALPSQLLYNYNNCISYKKPEELSHPTVNLPYKDTGEGKKQQYNQETIKKGR